MIIIEKVSIASTLNRSFLRVLFRYWRCLMNFVLILTSHILLFLYGLCRPRGTLLRKFLRYHGHGRLRYQCSVAIHHKIHGLVIMKICHMLIFEVMRKLLIILCFLLSSSALKAQDFGLSFSYFIPKNGYFSVPVTPFSIRGVGFDLNRFFAIESGFTLYRISGMGVKNLPYESKNPLIGPFFSLMVPLRRS